MLVTWKVPQMSSSSNTTTSVKNRLYFLPLLFSVSDENTYILTTDADVKFTHESVEALLDFMARDPTVGAVCGRTHPLGIGPIVWYQIFDYAIGHWFQKVLSTSIP